MHVNVSAIVLSARPASETDKKLTLFTREKGRVFARAAGARRPGARLAAATEPTVESRFRLWWAPESPSARVTGGAPAATFPAVRRDWARLTSALFLCEWVERLTPLAQAAPEKYDLLRSALGALETGSVEAVRLTFLIKFIDMAGYGPGRGDPWGVFRDWAWSGPPPRASTEDMNRWEESLVRSMSPLLNGPLRTRGQRDALERFRLRTGSAVSVVSPAPAQLVKWPAETVPIPDNGEIP